MAGDELMDAHHPNCAYPLGYSCTCEACDGIDREAADQ